MFPQTPSIQFCSVCSLNNKSTTIEHHRCRLCQHLIDFDIFYLIYLLENWHSTAFLKSVTIFFSFIIRVSFPSKSSVGVFSSRPDSSFNCKIHSGFFPLGAKTKAPSSSQNFSNVRRLSVFIFGGRKVKPRSTTIMTKNRSVPRSKRVNP